MNLEEFERVADSFATFIGSLRPCLGAPKREPAAGRTCVGCWYSRPTGAMPRIWPKRLPGPRPEPCSGF